MICADMIRNASFAEGFEAGYRAIKGTTVSLPSIPSQSSTRSNSTPFLMGVRKGIERALHKSISDLHE
ncbi:hypothetical protein BBX50_23955 [Ensifer sp. LC11]|nr:hypothetical protein BBX50_23955 [Ensifer sp. LC11]